MTYKLEQLENAIDIALADLVLTEEKRDVLIARCLDSPPIESAPPRSAPPWKKFAIAGTAVAAAMLAFVGIRVLTGVIPRYNTSTEQQATDQGVAGVAAKIDAGDAPMARPYAPESFSGDVAYPSLYEELDEAPETITEEAESLVVEEDAVYPESEDQAPMIVLEGAQEPAAAPQADAAISESAPMVLRFFTFDEAYAEGFDPPIPAYLPSDLLLSMIEVQEGSSSNVSHYGNTIDTSYLQIDAAATPPADWTPDPATAYALDQASIYLSTESRQNADGTEGELATASWQSASRWYRLTLYRPSGRARDELLDIVRGFFGN